MARTTCMCLRKSSTRSALAKRAAPPVGSTWFAPADVVAERRGRVDEHRARVADCVRRARRRRRTRARGARARRGSRPPWPARRRGPARPGRRRRGSPGSRRRGRVGRRRRRARRSTASRTAGVPRHEERRAAGPVLGLRREVERDRSRSAVCVGDHHQLRRAGRASMPTTPAPATLRLAAHVGVAGPDDHVDRRDRLGAVGHGARSPARRRPGTPRRRRRGTRRRASPAATGPSASGGTHSTRSGTPATAAGIAVISTVDGYDGPPAGHVEAGAVDRPDRLGTVTPSASNVAGGVRGLRLVVRPDAGRPRARARRARRRGGRPRPRPRARRRARAASSISHPSNCGGELPDRRVAAVADRVDDRRDRGRDGGSSAGRAALAEAIGQVGAAPRRSSRTSIGRSYLWAPSALGTNCTGRDPPCAGSADGRRIRSRRAQHPALPAGGVTRRVVAVADRYRDTDDSAIAGDLDSAERGLLTARRAIDRALRSLASSPDDRAAAADPPAGSEVVGDHRRRRLEQRAEAARRVVGAGEPARVRAASPTVVPPMASALSAPMSSVTRRAPVAGRRPPSRPVVDRDAPRRSSPRA